MYVSLRAVLVGALAAVVGIAAPIAHAQTNDEANAAIQFNLASPGARSLSLGGAFVGLADDATAAYTNPAGLTQISTPEVSAEGRYWSYTHTFADSGRASGLVTGQGLDTVAGVQEGEDDDDVLGFSFVSVVYPRERWAVALYRHQLANFEASFDTQGVFYTDPAVGEVRIRPVRTRLDLRMVNFGLSGSYEVSPGLSLGIGVSYFDLSLDSRTERFTTEGFFGSPRFDLPPLNSQEQHSDDADVAFQVGGLWRPEGQRWQVGAVYRQGPEFDVDVANLARLSPTLRDTATFHVPDIWGVGLVYEITRNWKVAFDYNRVQYSDLTDDFTSIFPGLNPDDYFIDDGNQYHLGFEYRFARTAVPFRVRFGGWQEPAHQLQYRGDDLTEQILFDFGDDDEHGTVGLGAIFLDGHLELNAAADFASRTSTGALSMVWRFLRD